MNVVIVDWDVSYPPTSGKRLRTLNLMLRLAGRHRLTYIARGDAPSGEACRAVDFLSGHGITPVVVHDPLPRKAGPLFYARLAANLLSFVPYSVASHTSPRMRRAVQEHAARHRVDLYQLEFTPFLEAVRGGPAPVRTVLNLHNVESLIWQRFHEVERHPVRRWYIGRQWRKFERFERAALAEATRVVVVSAEDAALVRDRFGVERVEVVDNGIDSVYFAGAKGCRVPDRILFLGSLEWRPNLDAVQLLLDRVFPAVRAREPSARLVLVGRNPPPWLRQRVGGLEGVELHADVPDVRPHLARSGVLAVPLRIGGGSRLKILEALASGLPVVSTGLGAEGLRLTPGVHLTVVESVEEMAGALLGCLRNPLAAQAQAERGRCAVVERYDWGPLADRLEQVWEECLRSGSSGPRVRA